MVSIGPTVAAAARLVEIASAAGVEAMRHYGACGAIGSKPDSSPVTAADRAAHTLIVDALAAWQPTIPIISEEGRIPDYGERKAWSRFWLVDPLDGTKEFITGNGEFTVNIALIEHGEPVLGVVAAPALGVSYWAARGHGAWRGTDSGFDRVFERVFQRVFAYDGPPRPTRIVESRSHPSLELDEYLRSLGPLERLRVGSSLKFCWIADGTADLYPRFGPTMEWDVAAGDCVYRNSSRDGRQRRSPLLYNQPSLCTPRFIIGSAPAGLPAGVELPMES